MPSINNYLSQIAWDFVEVLKSQEFIKSYFLN